MQRFLIFFTFLVVSSFASADERADRDLIVDRLERTGPNLTQALLLVAQQLEVRCPDTYELDLAFRERIRDLLKVPTDFDDREESKIEIDGIVLGFHFAHDLDEPGILQPENIERWCEMALTEVQPGKVLFGFLTRVGG